MKLKVNGVYIIFLVIALLSIPSNGIAQDNACKINKVDSLFIGQFNSLSEYALSDANISYLISNHLLYFFNGVTGIPSAAYNERLGFTYSNGLEYYLDYYRWTMWYFENRYRLCWDTLYNTLRYDGEARVLGFTSSLKDIQGISADKIDTIHIYYMDWQLESPMAPLAFISIRLMSPSVNCGCGLRGLLQTDYCNCPEIYDTTYIVRETTITNTQDIKGFLDLLPQLDYEKRDCFFYVDARIAMTFFAKSEDMRTVTQILELEISNTGLVRIGPEIFEVDQGLLKYLAKYLPPDYFNR